MRGFGNILKFKLFEIFPQTLQSNKRHTYYLVVKYKKEKQLFPAELTEVYS